MRKALFGFAGVIAILLLAFGAYAGQGRPSETSNLVGVVNDHGAGIEIGLPAPEEMACKRQRAMANDDYWTTTKNTPITASPLANDPDTPQNNLGWFGQPSHGTTELVGIDAIKYTPDTGFVGNDSFNYEHIGCLQCFNGYCSEPDSDLGTVFITVTE